MIPSAAIALLWLWCGGAHAQSAPDPSDPESGDESGDAQPGETDDDPISRYRTSFDELAQRAIGTASMPVAFSWRRTRVQVAATGSFLFELNNFDSLRAGGLVRLPTGGAIVELGVSGVYTWDTPSSELLALTPYRQAGRPSRMEVDLGLAFPLAEGVVTSVPRFFPAVQLVFNAYGSLRYIVYPGSYTGMTTRQVLSAIFSPSLSERELDNLEDQRLDAMAVDEGRYGLMLGLGNDLYFEQGFFLSPRVMLAVPILAWASGTDLQLWADVSMVVGMSW